MFIVDFLDKKDDPFIFYFIIFSLFFSGCVRTFIDFFWLPYLSSSNKINYLLTFFITPIYAYLLYLGIPGLFFCFLKWIYDIKVTASQKKRIYKHSLLTIFIIYPAVSLISIVFKSPPLTTIPVFKHLPFFMIESFFPIGMLVVIPFLLLDYVVVLKKEGKVSYQRASVCVSLSLVFIYLLFYQYLQRLSFHLLSITRSLMVYFGSLSLMYSIFTLFFVNNFSDLFGGKKALNHLFLFYTVASILLVVIGLCVKI